jgi:hypothetical protein
VRGPGEAADHGDPLRHEDAVSTLAASAQLGIAEVPEAVQAGIGGVGDHVALHAAMLPGKTATPKVVAEP